MRDPLQLNGFTEIVTRSESVLHLPLGAFDQVTTKYEEYLDGRGRRMLRGETLSGVTVVVDLAEVELISEVSAAEIARIDDLAEQRKAAEKLEG
jgi:hypothetical protein